MKVIGSWCGFLLFISAIAWLFLDPDKARPTLQLLFCCSFFAFIAYFCMVMTYRGLVGLPNDFKMMREPNDIKEKIWLLFFVIFRLLLTLVMVAVAGGSLRILYGSLKVFFH